MPLRILNIIPPPILKDTGLQKELDREGIISLPLLTSTALSELYALYREMHPISPDGPLPGFYVSVHSADIGYKALIESKIKEILLPFCDLILKNYTWVTAAMQIKKANPYSDLGVHQDWTVVDESRYASYGLWIPLVDVGHENGPISVLRRSHHIGPTYRHTALPSVYSQLGHSMDDYYTPYPVRAGEAIIFNQAMLHRSAANKSDKDRPSIVATIIPDEAQLLMYAPSAEANTLDAYLVPPDYVQQFHSFFEDSAGLPPTAQKTQISVVADFTPVSCTDFEDLYKKLL